MDREPSRSFIPRSFQRFSSSLPNLWGEMEDRMSQWMGGGSETGVTVSEDDQHVYIEAQLPGLKPEDLDISVNQNTVWIKGERKEEEKDKDKKFYRRARNSFFYQVELPAQVEENTEEAEFQDGVLTVSFKKTQQSQVRKISVREGNPPKNNSSSSNK